LDEEWPFTPANDAMLLADAIICAPSVGRPTSHHPSLRFIACEKIFGCGTLNGLLLSPTHVRAVNELHKEQSTERAMFATLRTSVLAMSAIASIGVATLMAVSPAEARLGFASTPGAAFTRFTSAGTTLQRHPGAAFNRFAGSGTILQQHPGAAFNRFAASGTTLQQHPGAAFTRFTQPGLTLQQHPGAAFAQFSRPNLVNTATTYAPAPVYAPAPTYAVAAGPTATSCLKKEYTQDGQVVFSDVCTNESVAGPIGSQVQMKQ
jgi:hypothetical protein